MQCALLLAASLAMAAPPAAQEPEPFPPATAAEVGLAAAALDGLAEVVRGWVEEQRVVGAELLVVQRRRTVLHAAWGWQDREDGLALEPGALFNLRSMTKPVVGTAAQVLLDEGLVATGDRVADHLDAFDRGLAGEITVEHLLTHTSGLPWSACMDGPSLQALAECCAKVGPREFVPGTGFLYSNAGSNTLGALLERAAERGLDELVEARVLVPLSMLDTFSLHRGDDPRLARCASRYVRGEDGGWERSWSPAQGAPMDFMQGAQGLGGTAQDYARLLALWMDGGVADGARLLSPEAVARGLRPAALTALPTTFPGRRVYYGQHWKLWSRGSGGELEAFGHSGSDGTFAWAFPRRDLIVVYMTPCADTPSGVELEREIDRWLLGEEEPAAPAALRPLVGHYWNERERMIRSVYLDAEGGICLDVPGTGLFRLEPGEEPLRFEVRGRPGFEVRFERDATGAVTTLVPPEVTGEEPSTRIRVDPSLPSADELLALRLGRHGEGEPGSLGVFRLSGRFTHSSGVEGADVLLSDGELRSREEVGRSRRGAETTVCNGERAAVISPRGRRRELSGGERERTLLARLAVVAGDWRRYYQGLEVVARTQRAEREVLVVHVRAREAPPTTYVVDAQSGLPLEAFTAVELPFGAIGKVTRLEDWRQIEGVWLPFRWVGRFASATMGTATVQYESIETHVVPPSDAFEIDPPSGR